MASSDDWKQVVRRNKLIGMWAAEKLGKTGQDAEEYSNALAVGTLDPERSNVLSKIRKDFDAAGVVQSDEQITQVMDDLMLQAGRLSGNARAQTPAGIGPGLSVMAITWCECWSQHVRFGSKADIAASYRNVRFTPESGH